MEIYKITSEEAKEIYLEKYKNISEETKDALFYLTIELDDVSADDDEDELYASSFFLIKDEENLKILYEALELIGLNVKIELVTDKVISGFYLSQEKKHPAIRKFFYKFKKNNVTIDQILDQINEHGFKNLQPVYKSMLSKNEFK